MRSLGAEGVVPASVLTLPVEADPVRLVQVLSRDPAPVLLQSARQDAPTGRFSIVASDPFLFLRSRNGAGVWRSLREEESWTRNPFTVLRGLLERYRLPKIPGIPFIGGAVGYLAYGMRAYADSIAARGALAFPWPDLNLAFYDRGFVVDHHAGCTHLVATGFPEVGPRRRREKQRGDLVRMAALVEAPPPREEPFPSRSSTALRFHTPREEYLRAIRRAQEYLAAGDIYQVNLSHRISVPGNWNPLPLYRRLMGRHPAAFSAYLPYPDHAVLCASPERLVRLDGRVAETRPIKGTRRRHDNPQADDQSARDLQASGKERAENVMIVDLARNDLGKVCVTGTVRTDELFRVETLPSVHHLVSTVSGRLRPECDGIDLVQALFPGGSMTGAPKIRAMEIIDELEGIERGVYSGSVGYFSFDSDLDLNIVIRTVILAGGSAHLQVGGAVLAESDPEAEYQETLDKARPILELLQGMGPA